ncbi:MAG: hypothetical protein NVS3B21_00890 [Acidimicrobiales bacterium]
MNRSRGSLIRALVAGGLLAVGLSFAGAVAAGAAGSPPPALAVRRIDSTAMPTVKVDVSTGGADIAPGSFAIKEDGQVVKDLRAVTQSEARTPVGTVLLVDTASTMNDNGKMAQTRMALKALIATKGDNEHMAIVPFGGGPRVALGFTVDKAALADTIDRLAVGGFPSLHSGFKMAGELLTDRPDLLGNIVIVGDGAGGPNAAETAQTVSGAYGQLEASRAVVYAVGLRFGPSVDFSPVSKLAAAGHGAYFEASDAQGVGKAFGSLHDNLSRQFELTYTSRLTRGSADLIVAGGGGSTAAQLIPGGIAVGEATHPAVVTVAQAPSLLRGKLGLLLIALLVLVAAALFVYAVSMLLTRDSNSLRSALKPYQTTADALEDGDDGSFLSTAFIQRAVDSTERFAEKQGFLSTIEGKLVQADVKLRPAEAIFFYAIGVVIVTVLAVALKGPLGIGIGLLAAIVPYAVLNIMARVRLKKFTRQLPDMLQLLSSSLRAGFSFMQGVEAVAAEVPDPMGSELRRVIVEARLGRPVEEALDDCVTRMQSPDFEWAVMAVKIQREVGGNLAELLQTVGITMVERERLRRDVKALTAEGRMSAYVLGCMPPLLGVFFQLSNPAYMHPLFSSTGGVIAVVAAGIAMVVGFIWMNKIIQIDV